MVAVVAVVAVGAARTHQGACATVLIALDTRLPATFLLATISSERGLIYGRLHFFPKPSQLQTKCFHAHASFRALPRRVGLFVAAAALGNADSIAAIFQGEEVAIARVGAGPRTCSLSFG